MKFRISFRQTISYMKYFLFQKILVLETTCMCTTNSKQWCYSSFFFFLYQTVSSREALVRKLLLAMLTSVLTFWLYRLCRCHWQVTFKKKKQKKKGIVYFRRIIFYLLILHCLSFLSEVYYTQILVNSANSYVHIFANICAFTCCVGSPLYKQQKNFFQILRFF